MIFSLTLMPVPFLFMNFVTVLKNVTGNIKDSDEKVWVFFFVGNNLEKS